MLEKFNTIRKNNKKIGVECTKVTRVTHRSEDTRMIQLWYDRCQSMMLGLGKILSKGYEYAISSMHHSSENPWYTTSPGTTAGHK